MGLARALSDFKQWRAETRASFENADAYGRLPIPGSVQLTLPAGDVKLWYFEARMADIDSHLRPRDLHVAVAPVSEGAALEIHGPGWGGKGRQALARGGWTIDLHGTVHVLSAGDYTVMVSGTPSPRAVEPQLLLGS